MERVVEGQEDLFNLPPRGTLVANMQKDRNGMGEVEEKRMQFQDVQYIQSEDQNSP
jgi:hypothetical protein